MTTINLTKPERTRGKVSQGTIRISSDKASRMRPRGGVHSTGGEPATRGLKIVSEPSGRVPAAAAFPNFSYHGGPVITCPQIYSTFWGTDWLSDPTHLARAATMSQFLSDLVVSPYMNVLNQYGTGSLGFFIRASFVSNVATTLTDPAIHGVIQNCINAGVLPEPPATNNSIGLFIYLDETIGINDPADGLVLCEASGDTAFGYHSFFTTAAGNPFYYAVMPSLSDQCLKESCANDGGCSLHLAQTQLQRLTQVTSHEFAEMLTDPQLNAWWDSSSGSEIGDICNGEADSLTVGANTWDVQREYSKTDDINSNGVNYCISQAPNTIPKLPGGPATIAAGVARVTELGALRSFLPLPPISFDAEAQQVSMSEQHVLDYFDKLLRPFRPTHLVPDLPNLLRAFASVLESDSLPAEAGGGNTNGKKCCGQENV
jgi:hypothetical protein